uniref:Metalloendopeptidase n=1 Tax=Neogobius melanostomus TaxID=47308 RepID=A0A8C6TKX4_9GOBI
VSHFKRVVSSEFMRVIFSVGDEDSEIEDGDVMVPKSHVQKRNADQCTRWYCKWRRSRDKKVYVPYVIANHYSSAQQETIAQAFSFFANRTCIRFVPRNKQRDYLYIHSSTGCFSHIGRRGRRQKLSLKKDGCIYPGIIQHELLHALGFHHEHKRSDRNKYIKVLWGNIIKKQRHNFRLTWTRNLRTPYDYSSVMHYSSKSFSKNGKPTLVARRPNVTFGKAKEMSSWDIERVNRLYCR